MWGWGLETGELATSPSLFPPSKERLCKVIMAFAVGKERVDSEGPLGAGEES